MIYEQNCYNLDDNLIEINVKNNIEFLNDKKIHF